MKFDQKYPDSPENFEPKAESIFKSKANLICWHCNASTSWIDYCFEAALCSEECYDAKWQEYHNAANHPLQCSSIRHNYR